MTIWIRTNDVSISTAAGASDTSSNRPIVCTLCQTSALTGSFGLGKGTLVLKV